MVFFRFRLVYSPVCRVWSNLARESSENMPDRPFRGGRCSDLAAGVALAERPAGFLDHLVGFLA